jgi:FAD/FMN-containing dehydrogenase
MNTTIAQSASVITPTDASPALETLAGTLPVVHLPGSDDYDAAVTPWNLAAAPRPLAVVVAQSAHDVEATIRLANEHGLRVAVQATGHGAAASMTDAILVTTSQLRGLDLHPDEGWVRAEAGVTWDQVLEAGAPHGLAGLCGSAPGVGVVGYTTGGGVGPLVRTHGLAADRVRAFEVVTGDGILRRVTPTEHPELFFGLRGGKGSLGIVTAVEFDLVHQPTFYGGSLWFDGADAATVIERWRAWCADLPELGTTSFALFQLPAMPGVPPQLAGRLTLSVRYVWTGDAADGERWFAAMRSAAPVLLDDVAEKPYAAIDSVHTDPLDPMPATEAATVLAAFPAEAAAALLAVAGPGSGSPQVLVEVRQMGGAVARGGEHASAFCSRDTAFAVLVVGIPGIPGVPEHAETVLRTLRPWAAGHRMPNFSFEPDQLVQAYDEPTLARLRAAIAAYDPEGVMAIGHALDA